MIKRSIFLIGLSVCQFLLAGCGLFQNPYHRETYATTDSYGSVFEGERIPQNVR